MDYLGEYQYRFRCIPYKKMLLSDALEYERFPFKVGDRIGQIYLEEVIPIEFEEVEELSETIRGTGGFGSSGN